MLRPSRYVRIIIAVPLSHAEAIRQVLGETGAGRQGNYDFCSRTYRQIGRFRPLAGSNPAIGRLNHLEEVEEEVIESLCDSAIVANVVTAVKKVHPYEEPAIDIVPLLQL